MSEPAGITAGIAARYASAVFDLAREDGAETGIESDLDALDAALHESADLRALIGSPLYSRGEQGQAVAAIAARMGLSPTMTNVLALLAAKRRLFVLPQMLRTLRERLATARGEVAAEVVSASPLSDDQRSRLERTLTAGEGRSVKVTARVDPSLIGGLVVRLGSRMIDTSVKSRLGRLQNMMKEV